MIGSTFKYCKMAKYIQMFKSQPTFEHVDMCGYCYMPVAYCTRGKTWVPVSEDGEECDDGEVDLGRH